MRLSDPMLAQLMRKAQAGDKQAYLAVLQHAQNWLQRFFAGRIAPHLVDDLVQDTLLSVHHKRATFDPDRPFLPWLAAIARYRWIDHLRSFYRHTLEELDSDHPSDAIFDSAIFAQISIDRMMAQLSPAQSTAIRLVKLDGLSIREASARSGQSEAAIKTNIHRGLKSLAAHVESL
jgi:RNA polymerase sigma factor (sigma-70 family)